MQGHQAIIDFTGTHDIIGQSHRTHAAHEFRSHVGSHGNNAGAAHQHQGKRGIVVAAVNRKFTVFRQTAQEFGSAAQITGGVFQTDNIRQFQEAKHGVVLQISFLERCRE